jgi:hypothetical protein
MLSTTFVTDDDLIFDPTGDTFVYNGTPSQKFQVSKNINGANHVWGHVIAPTRFSR